MEGENEEGGVERVEDVESGNDIDGADGNRRSLVRTEGLGSSTLVCPIWPRHLRIFYLLSASRFSSAYPHRFDFFFSKTKTGNKSRIASLDSPFMPFWEVLEIGRAHV